DRPRLGADQGPGADQPREQQGPAPVPEPGDRRERLHRLLGGALPRLLQELFRARADPPAAETRAGADRDGLTPSLVIPILEPLVHLLRPIAVASLMAAVAAGLGTLARGRPRGEESRWVEAGLDLALGLALLSALGFWLGLAGCLRMGALVLGAALLAGLLFLIRPRASPRNGRGQGVPAGSSALGEPGWRLALPILALVALPLAVLALYPPTAFDPTLYHLPYARAFVATGGLPYLPDLRFPVFPQASEVLFAEAMLFSDDRAAQLLSLVATLATAGILFSWARRAWGAEAGALAAGLFLGGPIVAYLSGTAYTEPLLVLFTAATFACLDRYLADEDPRRLAFAGFLAGTAAAVKYLGLFG